MPLSAHQKLDLHCKIYSKQPVNCSELNLHCALYGSKCNDEVYFNQLCCYETISFVEVALHWNKILMQG
ncbi:unnamed protein product [Trifolium pratense]|uniref:Uncharacterized protein n=1 Tax=Trifolium pratense TaxID=57577 RepID=A0ACB0IPM6_TRIPR|nr:unnamed protein product [Trifolium pratense]